ncbi:GIY-YIG nuclease family protein [Hymenobacter sp. BT491]|uniref:GIY-YIG nuclease family protein n=1 Tax=Hymenobacter sp. BT491 TaxID=2766779 RepID=UPI001653E91D|nr:GIY-YIG nuclease family protein [Hymenobacter sp. BT491]MBC6988924.1 GIY-YIG nuclease family protein [Hymenobacter sp. BT491]
MCKKSPTDVFIEKAVAVHGVRYDYSQVEYQKAVRKVHIVCPLHGGFEQTPNGHLNGSGCAACATLARIKKKTKSHTAFVAQARKIHGALYEYPQDAYKNTLKKMAILCPVHGEFRQTPDNHLHGAGCPACGQLKGRKPLTTKEQFIAKAQRLYNYKYDYSLVNILGYDTYHVDIICPTHGVFSQRRTNHLRGHGCLKCARLTSWIEQATGKPCILYFLRVYDARESFYKIGITTSTIERRFHARKHMPYQYEVLASCTSMDAERIYEWEQSILASFTHLAYRPKKTFNGQMECFSSCEEILEHFPL